MYKYIALVVCLFANSLQASVSIQQTKEVYNSLVIHSGITFVPKLVFDPSPAIQAYTNGREVGITKGMLEFLISKSDLAMILGHELTHAIHRDNGRGSYAKEYRADKGGWLLAQKLGYNRCNALQLFKRAQKRLGDGGHDKIHPKWTERYAALAKGC